MVAVYALHSAIARANTTDGRAVGEAANQLSEFSSFAGKIRLDDYGRSSERQAVRFIQYQCHVCSQAKNCNETPTSMFHIFLLVNKNRRCGFFGSYFDN